jgi:hypothetical protein
MRVNVGQYRELIGAVSQWAASVKSAATPAERARELESLKSAVAELRAVRWGGRLKPLDLERATAVLLEADRLIRARA